MRSIFRLFCALFVLTVGASHVHAQPGLPLSEIYNEDLGGRGWVTGRIGLTYQRSTGFMAFTSSHGVTRHVPVIFMSLISDGAKSPRWTNASYVTLKFSGRSVMMQVSKKTSVVKGIYRETLTMRIPYDYFMDISRSRGLSLKLVGNPNPVSLNQWQLGGVRALARKIKVQPVASPSTRQSSVATPQRVQTRASEPDFSSVESDALRKGMKGDAVLHWQIFLINQGLLEPPALGNFADRTTAATLAFQKKYRLPRTGIVDSATERKAKTFGYTR